MLRDRNAPRRRRRKSFIHKHLQPQKISKSPCNPFSAWYNTHMNNELEPFDDIQCEELIPEHWEGSPEDEPLTEADLEAQSKAHLEARTGEWEIEAARETLREMMAFIETLNKPNG